MCKCYSYYYDCSKYICVSVEFAWKKAAQHSIETQRSAARRYSHYVGGGGGGCHKTFTQIHEHCTHT